MHDQAQKILELSRKIKNAPTGGIKALIGFDGFVDEIVHVVDKRVDAEHFIRLDSMAEYGRRITRSAGLSTNIEMVTVRQKLGGNGPIFANALIEYGLDLTYIGALGLPDVHPVFASMVSRCRAIALSDPAHTDAIEFFDGKIISSKLEPFKGVNWRSLTEHAGLDALVAMMDDCDLVGFENWTMLPYMSEIWRHLLGDVAPRLKKRGKKPALFIDLADPEKRREQDIAEALAMIGQFSDYFNVIFGLNKKEACEIAQIMGMRIDQFESQPLQPLAQWIYDHVHVAAVVVHPVSEACAVTEQGYVRVEGPYCAKPILTTGAGDNFNAGLMLGIATGCTMEESLLLGTATSGYYVRNAASPELPAIAEFLQQWSHGQMNQ